MSKSKTLAEMAKTLEKMAGKKTAYGTAGEQVVALFRDIFEDYDKWAQKIAKILKRESPGESDSFYMRADKSILQSGFEQIGGFNNDADLDVSKWICLF